MNTQETKCTNPKCTNKRCVGCLAFAPKDTPDTEMEKMIIYDHHIARINHDKKGNIESIVVDIPPVLKDILTSRDTYWKERVGQIRLLIAKYAKEEELDVAGLVNEINTLCK